jgi:ArsR family transcriptional regulator, arsenate/arsenite/antimonite-responsive transcriptional repressor
MDISTAVSHLAALAQETRLEIFRLLVQNGPDGLCVTDIGQHIGIAPATLSFHLKELNRAGLTRARKESRHIFYAPDFAAMNLLLTYLTENCCGGAPCEAACTPAPKKRKAGSNTR